MKSIITIILLSITVCFAVADKPIVKPEANDTELNKLIEKRIEVNKALNKEFIEEAKNHEKKEILVPLEQKAGEAWLAYLNIVKESKDRRLKIITLEMELTQELLNAYYEEDILPADEVKKNIASAEKDLELLEIEKNK